MEGFSSGLKYAFHLVRGPLYIVHVFKECARYQEVYFAVGERDMTRDVTNACLRSCDVDLELVW
jgi:hypothetical protein